MQAYQCLHAVEALFFQVIHRLEPDLKSVLAIDLCQSRYNVLFTDSIFVQLGRIVQIVHLIFGCAGYRVLDSLVEFGCADHLVRPLRLD